MLRRLRTGKSYPMTDPKYKHAREIIELFRVMSQNNRDAKLLIDEMKNTSIKLFGLLRLRCGTFRAALAFLFCRRHNAHDRSKAKVKCVFETASPVTPGKFNWLFNYFYAADYFLHLFSCHF